MNWNVSYVVWMTALLLTASQVENLANAPDSRTVMDIEGYPEVFEMNRGASYRFARDSDRGTVKKTIRLIDFDTYQDPNYWFPEGTPQRSYYKAEVTVAVDGERMTLLHRPYQMPETINGIRLYVEAIKPWNDSANVARLKYMNHDVRFSACPAEESWGPESFQFPLAEYRWKANKYYNTWTALVPYNKRYYHRGEDPGLIPDRTPVLAALDGNVTRSPLPKGDGESNGILLTNEEGLSTRYAHMNTEHIRDVVEKGNTISAGTTLGKSGMYWDGRKSQTHDPHLHFELSYRNRVIGSYPYLMEAYFRTYSDDVLAVAGNYRFTVPGRSISLDARRSLSREDHRIVRYEWHLHNGKTRIDSRTDVTFSKPGLYSEELRVITANGREDRDYLQVRVYDPDRKKIARGWAYHYPMRNIKPGKDVLFWNRLINVRNPVIDYGDGTAAESIGSSTTHSYEQPGIYTVKISGTGPENEPASLKMEVKVSD